MKFYIQTEPEKNKQHKMAWTNEEKIDLPTKSVNNTTDETIAVKHMMPLCEYVFLLFLSVLSIKNISQLRSADRQAYMCRQYCVHLLFISDAMYM